MRKRIISVITVLTMLTSMLSVGMTVSAAQITQNQNSGDGVMLRKSAEAKDNGTVDIVIDAYTTGTVVSHTTATPSDIVLVLDVSGSMSEVSSYTRIPVNGTEYQTGYLWNRVTYYGFGTSNTYYVKTDDDTYATLTRLGDDSGNFIYYSYVDANGVTQYCYPIMDGEYTGREFDYPLVQFYRIDENSSENVSRMEAMKQSVGSFIDETLAMNASVSDDAQKHRMAIIKYADDSYYGGANNDIDNIDGVADAVIGNNKYSNGYNYTQLVHDFDVVDAEGDASLKAAVNSLTEGGATAVDYGVRLAQSILNNRTSAEKAARNEVVIVFSDGQPTHGNSFSETVANTALESALALKNSNVQVYTLSVMNGADSSKIIPEKPDEMTDDDYENLKNTNKFMHYLSSNYPNANSMSYAGEEDNAKNGYYMTPSEEKNIIKIFEQIIQNIGTPLISLDTSTVVTDTLSPYFNLTNEIDPNSNITIQTISKTGPASAGEGSYSVDDVIDPNITVTVGTNNRQIVVSGFDFDANYITDTPKGDGSYGKILRITINVTPDYDEIDNISPRTAEIPTNHETAPASIINPLQAEPVATTLSPTVILNKVSYEVDSSSFGNGAYDVYRLPGSANKTIFNPTKEGHIFSGWSSTDVAIETDGTFTMPAKDVVIEGTFTVNTHNITYSYTGAIPEGTTPADPSGNNRTGIAYGTPVNVAEPPTVPQGYSFSGWSTGDATVTDGTFTMPDKNVAFVGYFTANGNTPYKIEHYLQNLDGTYPETPADSYTDYGKTDTTATAVPKEYAGFKYDSSAENITSGTIKGDGSLVLKLYYSRESYDVEYKYAGTAPSDATALPEKASYKYGQTVTVADSATASGYTFHGWISETVSATSTETFEMPAHGVVFEGHFVANGDTEYKVEHYLQNVDGTGYDLDQANIKTHKGETGTQVTAMPIYFEGFLYSAEETGDKNEGTITGDGLLVLKLYYNREVHNVSYTYIGIIPTGAPALPETAEYRYGATVTVEQDAQLAGYTFEGWTSYYGTVGADDATFTMPNQDVQLRGQFIPRDDTVYTVEHWTQKRDGTYELKAENIKTHTGITGTSVTALPIDILGYTYNDGHENNVKTGEIAGDGSLKLILHYDREPLYTVTYLYTGTVPAGAPLLPETQSYIQGETVTIAVISDIEGYDFSGWTSYGGAVQPDDTSFSMPNRNVTLSGHFIAKDTTYKVKHYHQTAGGTDAYTLYETEENLPAKVGADVVGTPKTYAGYVYSIVKTGEGYKGKALPNDGLTLEIYYDKIPYTVTYSYYGIQPKDISLPELPTEPGNKYMGESITIKELTDIPAGYIFQGWYSSQVEVLPTDTAFTMPEQNVTLLGRFVPAENTPYKVEHYTESGSDYTLYKTEDFTGTTGEIATATPLTISGYKYYPGHSETVLNGIIWAEPMLVLKLYYSKTSSGGGGGGSTPSGYVEITKTVSAPDGAVDDSQKFTFDIMKENNGKKTKVKTVTVKAGESKSISLDTGTYYIYEQEQSISGYTLKVNCDTVDNKVEIKQSRTSKIAFENVYTAKSDMLEKDDHHAYIVGYPDGDVRPNAQITRAEVATIFFRMMTDQARAEYRKSANSFSDVKKGDWYNTAISTLANAEILDGYADGTFRPDSAITRAELSKIAAAFYKMQTDSDVKLSDISGHWAENFIKSAHGYGFIDGYPDGTFKPDQPITRAETMKIVNRALERMPNKDNLLDNMIKWPDNSDKAEWYYADVQEATNSHTYKKNGEYEIWTGILPVRDWAAIEITE